MAGATDARQLVAALLVEGVAGLLGQLHGETVDRPQRRTQVVRDAIGKRLQPPLRGLQVCGALAYPLFKAVIAVAQFALRGTLGGDVLQLRDEVERVAVRVPHQGGIQLDVDDMAIAVQITLLRINRMLHPRSEILAKALGDREIVRMADIVDPLADQLIGLAPEHPAQRRIDIDEASIKGHDRHPDPGRRHGQAKTFGVLVVDLVRGHRQ